MPVSRMRMRPWLENQIDSNSIDGLMWINKDKLMFSIPWKHAARHGWQMDKDACLFKKWAIHTGKFRPGVTKPDPKTWKANFRCAMNSLPDIEEVKDQSINKGCGAVRVYRMLPEVSKKKDKRSKSRDGKKKTKDTTKVKREDRDMCAGHPTRDRSPFTSMEDDSLTQENTIDSTDDIELPSRPCMDDAGVPDFSSSVEIGPDSTNDWSLSFQVSPQHSIGYDDDVIGISQQLERDPSQWFPSDVNGRGFLSNEVGTTTESHQSPQSQWSDASDDRSVELQLVTELVSDWSQQALLSEEQPSYGEMWSSNIFNTLTVC
ncbi:interferon regulatory factor 1b [Clupea harengus]|uniref:Interferon regulatory factor n=1 Tax=Clupea harengus TaxID=7950 RepID=A0A6P3VR28_CLUHA|nr:interferon regulatory factor 1b [Clupea harengus]